jgi:excisionase family DNA binding protein
VKLTDNITKAAYDLDGLLHIQPGKRSYIYNEIKTKRLRATKMGRRTIFLADDVAAWLEGMRAKTLEAHDQR